MTDPIHELPAELKRRSRFFMRLGMALFIVLATIWLFMIVRQIMLFKQIECITSKTH
jgi:hypothetical protein